MLRKNEFLNQLWISFNHSSCRRRTCRCNHGSSVRRSLGILASSLSFSNPQIHNSSITLDQSSPLGSTVSASSIPTRCVVSGRQNGCYRRISCPLHQRARLYRWRRCAIHLSFRPLSPSSQKLGLSVSVWRLGLVIKSMLLAEGMLRGFT
jgi:hypothetical protein